MPDLFISHATKDDTHADALAAALATHDLTCWIDHQGGLEPGDPNWDRAIRDAIKTCGAGLLQIARIRTCGGMRAIAAYRTEDRSRDPRSLALL